MIRQRALVIISGIVLAAFGFPLASQAGERPAFWLVVGTTYDATKRTVGWDQQTNTVVSAGTAIDAARTDPWVCKVVADPAAEDPRSGHFALAVECKLPNGLELRFGTGCSKRGTLSQGFVDLRTPKADKVRIALSCIPRR